ncbi:MAG: glutaminyl-peptide cyclotransferase [Chitinophagaceae bacterium]
MMCKYHFIIPVFLALVSTGCNSNVSTETDNPLAIENTSTQVINYALVNTYPHDTASFTEGLLINNGNLYESTGSPENMPQTKSLFGTFRYYYGKDQYEGIA